MAKLSLKKASIENKNENAVNICAGGVDIPNYFQQCKSIAKQCTTMQSDVF